LNVVKFAQSFSFPAFQTFNCCLSVYLKRTKAMRKVTSITVLSVLIITGKLFAQAGILDASFGNNGIVITNAPAYNEAFAAALQPDGKIVAAGYSGNYGSEDFAVSRYNTNGSLDNSFGTGGRVVTALSTGTDQAEAVVIQPDGKIVMTGYVILNGITEIAVVRYLNNGTLDSTFGTQGVVLTVVGAGYDYGYSLKLQPDGKIIVAGYTANGLGGDIALLRYNADGSLDMSFGTGGIVTADYAGDYDAAFQVLLQTDGKIITAGTSSDGTKYNFGVFRFNANGSLDNSFGTGGKVITSIGTKEDQAGAAVLQADGKIVAAGGVWNATLTDFDFGVVRYNTNGTLDNTFGTGGIVVGQDTTDLDSFYGMTIQSDGKIVCTGLKGISPDLDILVTRFNTNGSPDTSFNSTGEAVTDLGTNDTDVGYDVLMQTDGKILVAGRGSINASADVDLALVRYLSGLDVGVIDFSVDNNSLFVYPNPIAANATLDYTLTQTEKISIDITDMQGRIIYSLVNNQVQNAGKHEQDFQLPATLASGTYLLVLSAEEGKVSVKIIH
jgi:uncharacterized delta-60 repeat protein